MILELFFNSIIGNITNSSLDITIDGISVEYSVSNNTIKIESTLNHGCYMLCIKRHSPVRFNITDVKINGSGLRHFLYLSWTQSGVEKMQPCTEIWEDTHVWHLPFGLPVSGWFDCVLDGVKQNLIGKNLYDHYDIFYPDSLNLPDTFPSIVKDFFRFNQTFTAVSKKDSIKKLPYAKLNIDQAKLSALANSSVYHYNNKTFFHLVKSPPQSQYNAKEDLTWKKTHWMTVDAAESSESGNTIDFKISQQEWPELYEVIDFLKPNRIDSVAIAYLAPGANLVPHRDRAVSKQNINIDGLAQMYIPLHYKNGNFIKFGKAGILDKSSGPMIINSAYFTHSAVNMSNDIRSVLTIRCDIEKNKHLLL